VDPVALRNSNRCIHFQGTEVGKFAVCRMLNSRYRFISYHLMILTGTGVLKARKCVCNWINK